jgi:hypothetical protein
LLKLALPLAKSPLSLRKRVMGILQLMPYPSQPLALCILLLMPVMILTHALTDLPLGPLGLMSATIPIMYVLSQQMLYKNWVQRSFVFPVLMIFSSGLTVNNSRAAISAFLGQRGEFKRTPKFNLNGEKKVANMTRQLKSYGALVDKNTLWELLFGSYALGGALLASIVSPSLIPYFAMYVLGFFSVALWSIRDRYALQSV